MSNSISTINTSHLLATHLSAQRTQTGRRRGLKLVPLFGAVVDPEKMSVAQLVSYRAHTVPHAIALKSGAEALSYGELDQIANQLAHYLITLGVGPDSLVGLCLERSLDSVICALGVLKAGAAYLPLDPSYPIERLAFMLNDAQPHVLITRGQIASQLQAGLWKVIDIDSDEPQLDRHPTDVPFVSNDSEDLAYVIYTSGSTGEPKGVEITHGSLLNLMSWHQRAFQLTAGDRASHLAGVGFDAAVWEIWPYLTAGASLHLPDEATRLAPESLRDWFVAEQITVAFLPTVLAERVLDLEWPSHTALRFLLTGADTLHRFPPDSLPFKLINNYGPTECTVVATSGIVQPGLSRETLPTIGKPIANTEIYILDENLRQVPAGTVGELHIGGRGLARGYRNRPDLTAAKFIQNPFSHPLDRKRSARLYKTGDLARYLPNGEIAYVGRADDQIKIMGYRIEPNEIVVVLNRHPAVQASVIRARDNGCSEKILTAYVVLDPTVELTASDLRTFLGAELPDYMVPSLFLALEALPLTPNGKVDVKALPEPAAENTLWDEVFTAPRTPLETKLASMLSALLGLAEVSVNDNFFLLGGHSLLGTQLIGQIRNAFGVDLALRSLFDAPTIAELALEIEGLLLAKVAALTDDEVQRLLV
jgi:amino acid adenylation domain-containing protein